MCSELEGVCALSLRECMLCECLLRLKLSSDGYRYVFFQVVERITSAAGTACTGENEQMIGWSLLASILVSLACFVLQY